MSEKRTYFRLTTAPQRELLFKTWIETGDIATACQEAHVSRGSFYYWKPRFEEAGYAGLVEPRSHVPHHPRRKSTEIEAQVLKAHAAHPGWGKTRIAQELAKANNWVPVISPNAVRAVLKRHGLWPQAVEEKKGEAEGAVRHAEQPGMTINVDICFVPTEHMVQESLPAVSGSSGRLVLCHRSSPAQPPAYPGQVFGQAELSYEEAMQSYVQATRDRLNPPRSHPPNGEEPPSAWRKEHERQDAWYRIRQRREQEDRGWRAAKMAHRQALSAHQALSRKERQQQRAVFEDQQRQWQQVRQERQQRLASRPAETAAWHERNRLADPSELTGCAHPWFAILVITDNCTRQCLGLPLFQNGMHLTSQELVQALAPYLPDQLAFLISDQDFKIRSQALAQLARTRGFIHVPIYRHRPQSNGIAEHFVWTLKAWLEAHSWDSAQQLAQCLLSFQPEYNARPHQGIAIPGLSPNEFANRIWLF